MYISDKFVHAKFINNAKIWEAKTSYVCGAPRHPKCMHCAKIALLIVDQE